MRKAVVIFSGGLDSTTALAIAQHAGYTCYALSFNYTQRNVVELAAAKKIAALRGVQHSIFDLPLDKIGGSALTDQQVNVPDYSGNLGIPPTYVPARNTIFLSIALGFAEVLNAEAIFLGISHIDYSGYPDCRPEYLAAFQTLANLATKASTTGRELKILAPLLYLSKAETIKRGVALGVDYALTVSCYQPDAVGRACGRCDSCTYRKNGFAQAGIVDPTPYQ